MQQQLFLLLFQRIYSSFPLVEWDSTNASSLCLSLPLVHIIFALSIFIGFGELLHVHWVAIVNMIFSHKN